MKEDISLEQIFSAYQPHLGDKDDYMLSLRRKFEAIDYLKRYQEREQRSHKKALVIALIVGILIGCAGMTLISLLPPKLPIFTFGYQHYFLVLLAEQSRSILLLLISLLTTLALIAVLNIWKERDLISKEL